MILYKKKQWFLVHVVLLFDFMIVHLLAFLIVMFFALVVVFVFYLP